jgi:hypothetical protein
MNIPLRIAPAAADFIRKKFDEASEESVLVIAGFVRGTHKIWEAEDWEALSLGEIQQIAKTSAAELPAKLLVDYYVSTNELKRAPPQDVHVVDGIKCFLPAEMIAMLGEREIVLDNGELRIDPPLAPVEISR